MLSWLHGVAVTMDCLQILVAHGAPLFTENTLKQTPCDCAEKAYHSDIALYLESKMVFSVSSSSSLFFNCTTSHRKYRNM